ncbi:MAG: alginate lyase family protein [Anaerolineaceae bacterium]|nr:alginate lyase family protein [Anaerolineaceae bacterium]
MFNRIKNFASLYLQLGPRWSAFRVAYAFRLRTGLIRLQMPMGEWGDYKRLLAERSDERSSRHAVEARQLPENIPWDKQQAITEADRILNGEIKYFSHDFIKTGFPPDWHKDYVTLSGAPRHEGSLLPQSETLRSAQSDMNKHWSQISDDSSTDIKFIWEPNRFTFIYTLVRAYAAAHDEKYPEAFWTLIEDWAQHNPPNTGPNWMDGQEITLRLMAWTFGYSQFSNSPSSTPNRKAKFILLIAAQAERIYKNIGYAISTKSNHTISEAFGLWMVSLLFPELKHAKKYLFLGRKLLEQSAAEQIFSDGAYSMYSLNYHRFILHIYLYAIRLGDINHFPLSTELKQSVSNSITYLSRLINPETGEMPTYGSNDGALVLPLNNCNFTDYRPLLQLGWYITKKEFLFEPGPWDEDVFWLCGESQLTAKSAKNAREEKVKENLRALSVLRGESFSNGGVYILQSSNSRAIIHCTDFTSRPSHADQLHVDLWIRNHNIAIDAGTYLYSGQGVWRNGLAHTNVHNTVTVDGKDQMTMVSRFTWTNWSKGKVLQHNEKLWQGEHDGYKPVTHKRTVMSLEGDRWIVIDTLTSKESRHYALHWLLSDFPFEQKDSSALLSVDGTKYKVQVGIAEGNNKFSLIRADSNSARGWRSRYYGHKEPAISLMLEATQPQVAFWTFFGFEDDMIEATEYTLKVNGVEIIM